MTGIYQHSIDAKGRLFIPARLREELGECFYVTLSMEKCLSIYSLESWGRFEEKMRSMQKAEQIRMRPIFSHASKCDIDGQGRILLSKDLRNRGGLLDSNVTVVGAGDCVEIWDAKAWEEIDEIETTPENIAQVFKELYV